VSASVSTPVAQASAAVAATAPCEPVQSAQASALPSATATASANVAVPASAPAVPSAVPVATPEAPASAQALPPVAASPQTDPVSPLPEPAEAPTESERPAFVATPTTTPSAGPAAPSPEITASGTPAPANAPATAHAPPLISPLPTLTRTVGRPTPEARRQPLRTFAPRAPMTRTTRKASRAAARQVPPDALPPDEVVTAQRPEPLALRTGPVSAGRVQDTRVADLTAPSSPSAPGGRPALEAVPPGFSGGSRPDLIAAILAALALAAPQLGLLHRDRGRGLKPKARLLLESPG
jgi:hypothetical protein